MYANKHLVIIPRWSGTPANDWYPWFLEKAQSTSLFKSIHIADMPNPENPTIESWSSAIAAHFKNKSDEIANTILVGHSVGCQAVLHYLNRSNLTTPFYRVVCVAGWWTVDNPWETIKPWMEAELNFTHIKKMATQFEVILSDNDPFTSNVTENAQLWKDRLDAKIKIVSGAKHFNGAEEPDIWKVLSDLAI